MKIISKIISNAILIIKNKIKKMKILMINILTISNYSDSRNIERFFILLEFMIITNLINLTFAYFIETISNFVINVKTKNIDTIFFIFNLKSNFFAFIVTEQYITKEFYDIVIDINASNTRQLITNNF